MSNKVTVNVGGVGFYIFSIFAILKLAGVIDVSWWVITIPLWASFAVFGLLGLGALIYVALSVLFSKAKH